jgi:uncharacterized protein (DUF302 family)
MTPAGLITMTCRHGPKETMDRVVDAVEARGMSVFARIDHAAAAHSVGLELRPTEVLVFGSPRAGTLLMQAAQTIGIDLPIKVLVWQDNEQRTWLSYSDPGFLVERHQARGTGTVVAAMSAALAEVARDAAGGQTS